MNWDTLQFIKSTLQTGKRHLFHYAADHYAVMLLRRLTAERPMKIADLKQSYWGKLLDRPNVKASLQHWGDGMVNKERLQLLWPDQPFPFRITYSHWGVERRRWNNYDQTSRPGYNLVIQLNFDGLHNKTYQKLIKNPHSHPFHYRSHPGRAGAECTLAWARVDIAEDFSVALVEEIQNDWWRIAKKEIYTRQRKGRDASGRMREWTEKRSIHRLEIGEVEHYLDQVLHQYGKIWDEAMLAATLHVLWDEIGVDKVYYHDYKSGCVLKNCTPPQSIYTKLPKKFCFQLGEEAPSFLEQFIKKSKKLRKAELKFWTL